LPDLSPITVLFDLDRTLLHSNGGTRRGMELAGRAVWGGGFTLEGVQRGGRLDEHILQDGCRELGPGWRDLFFSGLQRFLELYEQVLPGELKCTTALPGARAAVSALATRRDRVLGVVTPAGEAEADWLALAGAIHEALGRKPKPREAAILAKLHAKHAGEYSENPASADQVLSVGLSPAPSDLDKTELAAWTSVARVILNLHETITRN